ncbi:MAG: ATP-binding protein [Candidatus Methanomethylicia archaeon]
MKELLFKQNPWWEGKKDYHVEKWESMKIRWIPKWIKNISLKPYSLNFIVGPRQTGKTTGVKLLIRKLLKKFRAESIFYFDCTLLADMESLRRVLDEYLEIKKLERIENSFIFLDEVTSLKDWWRIVKGYVDMGIFKNDVLIISGSSSLKLKREAELFPGRRGKGKDIFVLPLTFREFLEVNGIVIESTGKVEEDMKSLWRIEGGIREKFKVYLNVGGFPISINEDPTAELQLISSIESELLRTGKSLELTKAILSTIFKKAPSPLSFSTIGSDVGVSYKTAQDYLEVLQNLFILNVALFKRDEIKWRKERKFFFSDPFLTRTLSLWCGEKYLESAFYEWIVQEHLWRKFGSVYYFRNRFEIDCIAGSLKIEVKVGKPHRDYPKNVLILDLENLPIFLAVL